ncbi:hypothetical protein [Streptomyces shenzhenensis]|uniref:hypothetical protein n=1 Tax=Streptomyces shenzhenensis TaxID=943815 RepID=UPI0037D9998B
MDLTDTGPPTRFRDHRACYVITSLPGPVVILGAEFLAATGGDTTAFGTTDPLTGFGGVTPMPPIPGRSATTGGARADTIAASNASSTPRRCSASARSQ